MEVATTFFKTSSRRLPEDVLKTSFRRCPQDVFQEMSSIPLPGYVLKTSLRRLKTSSRLFLVRAKDHLETLCGLCIYVSFKLVTYYHSIIRQTNWINLNKLNTLKYGNNAEIMKTWFCMNCQTIKCFFQEFRYFLSIGVLHAVPLLSL